MVGLGLLKTVLQEEAVSKEGGVFSMQNPEPVG